VIVNGVNDPDTCTDQDTPCSVSVLGTTLEQPPGQPNGGGFNSSLSSDTVNLATPLAPGASINVHFLLGVQQTGSFKFYVNVEVLTDESSGGGEFLKPGNVQGLRKRVRGTIVKSGIAEPAPAAPQPAVQTPQPTVQSSGAPTPEPTQPVIERARPKGRLLMKTQLD
jgi:hypothetical protein